MKDIFFVIPVFKENQLLLSQLLLSIADQNIILVNNNRKKISYSASQIINNNKNIGFAGGANRGMEHAYKKGASWAVVMNQDLKADKKSLKELSGKLKGVKKGLAGPFSGYLDFSRWTTVISKNSKFSTNYNKIYLSGSCVAIHRSAYELLNGFYEPYFMYYEDADLSKRAKTVNIPITHVPVRGIIHEFQSALGVGSKLHEYYLARNHLLFVERNAPLSVKTRELIRFPKTYVDHRRNNNIGAVYGLQDYLLKKFGECSRKELYDNRS